MYKEVVKAEKGRDETTVGIKPPVEELRFSPRGAGSRGRGRGSGYPVGN